MHHLSRLRPDLQTLGKAEKACFGSLFKPSLMFVVMPGAYARVEHSGGLQPYLQTLGKAEKA